MHRTSRMDSPYSVSLVVLRVSNCSKGVFPCHSYLFLGEVWVSVKHLQTIMIATETISIKLHWIEYLNEADVSGRIVSLFGWRRNSWAVLCHNFRIFSFTKYHSMPLGINIAAISHFLSLCNQQYLVNSVALVLPLSPSHWRSDHLPVVRESAMLLGQQQGSTGRSGTMETWFSAKAGTKAEWQETDPFLCWGEYQRLS